MRDAEVGVETRVVSGGPCLLGRGLFGERLRDKAVASSGEVHGGVSDARGRMGYGWREGEGVRG